MCCRGVSENSATKNKIHQTLLKHPPHWRPFSKRYRNVVPDYPFKAEKVTFLWKIHASAKINFQNLEFGSRILYIGERFLFTERIPETLSKPILFHRTECIPTPTRRLLIFRNANKLKTTRQTKGSGIPATGNPTKSVRVLASRCVGMHSVHAHSCKRATFYKHFW